jgi:beta-lactamase class A
LLLTNVKTMLNIFNSKYLKISLFLLLLVSVVLNTFLFKKVNQQESNEPQLLDNSYDYKWLSPHLDMISRENRLIHFSPLKEDIAAYLEQYKDLKISVYFEYLITGTNFSINVDYYTYPASLTKVPISIMVMNKVNKGEITMDTKLPINNTNRDSLSGELYKLPNGTDLTIKELVEATLVNSDNTAKNILYGLISSQDLNDFINELGMDKLFNEKGDTTAKEYARVFRSLYYASMLTKEDSEYLLDLLTKTNRQKFMTAELPNDVQVAHKYASTTPDKSYSDVGIVFVKDRPFLLAITLDGRGAKDLSQDEAREIISTITKKTYDYVISK